MSKFFLFYICKHKLIEIFLNSLKFTEEAQAKLLNPQQAKPAKKKNNKKKTNQDDNQVNEIEQVTSNSNAAAKKKNKSKQNNENNSAAVNNAPSSPTGEKSPPSPVEDDWVTMGKGIGIIE